MSSVPQSTYEQVRSLIDPESLSPSAQLGLSYEPLPQTFARHAKDVFEIAIIDDRPLIRDCFGRSLSAIEPDLSIRYYSNPDDLCEAASLAPGLARVVLLCVIWSKARSETLIAQIAALKASDETSAIVIVSDIEDLNEVTRLIENGASGYIPNTISLEVAVKAIQLVAAGGVYIPASVLHWSNTLIREMSEKKKQPESAFTSRQVAVIEALRRGKANKIIAYELNMCESTVKVHIRNVMKKLKAKNRTEVAYILNSMNGGDSLGLPAGR